MQANSRSECRFCYKTDKVVVCKVSHPLLPSRLKLSFFSLYGQRFLRQEPFFKIAIFGHDIWSLEDWSQSCISTIFLNHGVKLRLSSLYRHPFSRHWLNFKISTFGHEIWNWKKAPKLHMYSISTLLPQGFKIKLIFAPRTVIFEIQADFQMTIFGHDIWNLKEALCRKLHIYSLSTPRVELKLIFAQRAAVLETEQFKALIGLIN